MAVLEVRRPDRDPETVRVTRRKPVTVGSHPTSNVPIDEADSLHCRIAWNGEAYEVIAAGDEDVELNGEPTRQAPLGDGDKIRISDVVIKMHRGSANGAKAKAPLPVDDVLDDDIEEGPPPRKNAEEPEEAVGVSDEKTRGSEAPPPERDAVKMSIRDRIRSRRPGQNSPLQSPLIYGLSAAVVGLMVAFLALSLFIRGKAIGAEFDVAKAAYSAEKYGEAETKLSEFLLKHPGHPLADEANRLLAFTKVDRLINGVPKYAEGLQQIDALVAEFREEDDFEEMKPEIADRGGIVAKGAAVAAGSERDEGLIDLSRRAEKTLVEFSPVPPKGLQDEIEAARKESRETIIRLNVRDNFLSRMTASSKAGEPLKVVDQYIAMTDAEPKLAKDRETSALNEKAIEAVLGAVGTADVEATSSEVGEQTPSEWSVVNVAVVERPAGEGEGDGVAVAIWADETLFAADRQSGEPLWRRPLPDSFEPVQVNVPNRAQLAFLAATRSLVLLNDEDGSVGKSLSLENFKGMPGRPTVVDAAAFVPVGDTLLRIDLAEMRVAAAATFGQPILPDPAFVRGDTPTLLVLGDEQMAYLLDAGTLELKDSLVLGHDTGTVMAPPLGAAEFSIIVVNDAKRRSTMYLLSDRDGELVIADTATIDGTVVDPPVLRGRNLYLPTSGEIVAVMAVRDEDGGRLAGGPKFSPGADQSQGPVPTYLLAEADREFWLAGRRLRRLRVTAESVQPADRTIPLGRPTQPPVGVRDGVLAAARRGDDDAVTLSRIDTSEMRELWQTHFSGELIAWLPVGDTGLVGVTSHGHFVRVNFGADGFQTSAVDKSDGTPASAVALSNRIAVADGDKIIFVSSTGRRQQVLDLGEVPNAPLAVWNDALVVPLAGKLRVIPQRGRPAPADFLLGQQGDAAPAWRTVVPLDENRLLAVDETGTARVLSLATQPRPFLSETASAALPEGTTTVAAGGGRIFAVVGGSVSELDPSSLAVASDASVEGGTVRYLAATVSGALVLTESSGGTAISRVDGDTVSAATKLTGRPAADPLVVGEDVVVTLDQSVAVLSAESLEPVETWTLPSAAGSSADRLSGHWVVPLDNGGIATRPAD